MESMESMERQCKCRDKEMNGLFGIRDIQYNQKLSKEEWERLYNVSVQELELPVRITNMLLRSGYHTVGCLADATVKELKQIDTGREHMQEHLLVQILEKLKELKIELPTEMEKRQFLHH